MIDTNSVALVTGASRGIGRSVVLELARRGVRVVLLARSADRLLRVAEEASLIGPGAIPIPCDVTDRTSFEHAVDTTIETFGRIDLLLNNAGRGLFAYVDDTSTQHIEEIFRLNVFSLWYGSARALRYMRRRGSGCIATMASMAGKIGYPANAPYVAAKHAAVGFTRALRTELAGSGVTATVILPGGTLTEWADRTGGGPMSELFAHEGLRGSQLASEMGREPIAPLPLLTPDQVAITIVEALSLPAPPAEIYTHAGSAELALEYERDQSGVERHLEPYWLANLEYGRQSGRLPDINPDDPEGLTGC